MDLDTMRDWDLNFRKQVITRFDALMMGVLGAYLVTFKNRWWSSAPKLKMLFGAALLLLDQLAFFYNREFFGGVSWYHAVPSFLVFATGTFLFLPALASYRNSKRKLAHAVTGISLISYSMYLIHYTFTKGFVIPLTLRGELAERTMELDIIRFGIYLVFTTLASILIYKYFEVPTTRLRDKFGKRR